MACGKKSNKGKAVAAQNYSVPGLGANPSSGECMNSIEGIRGDCMRSMSYALISKQKLATKLF